MKKLILVTLCIGFQASAYNFKVVTKKVGQTEIPFVQNADLAEKTYDLKASYAQIEKMAPLTPAQLAGLKPEDIRGLSMEEYNQLYSRLGSGPMPLGDYSGYVMQKPPIYNAIKKRLLRQVMAASAFADLAKEVCGRDGEDCLLEFIWKGKRFWPKNDMDQILTMSTFNPVSSGFKFSLTPNFLKNRLLDQTSAFAEGFINKLSPVVFPMNTYCGISQVDTRRESIITDGGFGDDFPSLPTIEYKIPIYVGLYDEMVTRKGLNISEEYRMVRPGLYMGKAYTNKLFLFNVVLEKSGGTISNSVQSACLDTIKGI